MGIGGGGLEVKEMLERETVDVLVMVPMMGNEGIKYYILTFQQILTLTLSRQLYRLPEKRFAGLVPYGPRLYALL